MALADGYIDSTECRYAEDGHSRPAGLPEHSDSYGGYGNFVLVRYPMGDMPTSFQQQYSDYAWVYVLYAHLMPCATDLETCNFDSYANWQRQGEGCGDVVRKGQAIGRVDNSGTRTSGTHLHLEVFVDDDAPLRAGPYHGGKNRICPELLFDPDNYSASGDLCDFPEGDDIYTTHSTTPAREPESP